MRYATGEESVPHAEPRRCAGRAGRSFRHLRKLTQSELGKLVHVSANRIAQIEAGTDPAPLPLLTLIDAALRAGGGELLDLMRHVSNPAYENYAERFLKRQAEAVITQEYSMVIPGLLQTEEYMRVLFESSENLLGEAPMGVKLANRLRRQEPLRGEGAPWYRVTLLESALRFNVGGPKAGPALDFPLQSFSAFLAGLKTGTLNELCFRS
ncbi:Scr1 family TA system antitoxin-like transcriptional regulator [Kitasatospora sp. NPDC006697]|uniref:Scr1 family TA system antitoxin-like transcriptional regulator n=1 Tax=Kitasatospora sp. NPDC006697 TaxID=3364020 RepID=UPI00367377E2